MAQVEQEIDEEKNLDEGQFKQYETGELNLPSDQESDDGDSEIEGNEDNDLDDYYRELGIDPEEMKPQRKHHVVAVQKKEKDTAEYTTREKKEAPF